MLFQKRLSIEPASRHVALDCQRGHDREPPVKSLLLMNTGAAEQDAGAHSAAVQNTAAH